MTTDPKEAAIKRLADEYREATTGEQADKGMFWPIPDHVRLALARIAIEQGVVPACANTLVYCGCGCGGVGTITSLYDGIPWAAVCAGEKP